MEQYLDALAAALRRAVPEWRETGLALSRERLVEHPHGDLPRWRDALADLPGPAGVSFLDRDCVTIGAGDELDAAGHERLESALRALMPWRKGPFRLFDVHIDTEWRSDWKWRRLEPHIQCLAGRRVLDVGCGSGYHCWRMAGAGAEFVLGVDPTLLFMMQYLAVRHLVPRVPVWYLPVRIEEMPSACKQFDTVFSMGVLYHQRSPLDHLLQLKGALRVGGELVLETLVVTGDERTLLMPRDRYAMMRNVWFLPSAAMLSRWLQRCGFVDVRVVDESDTGTDEQRATDWMRFQSLADFLDPADSSRTREGYPAPRRAVLIARKP